VRTILSKLLSSACVLLSAACIAPYSLAQQGIDASTLTPFATGLQGPRGMAFGPDGTLYVAEGGTGGTSPSPTACSVAAPIGPYTGGPTARISRIDSTGKLTTLATGLPSAKNAMGDISGVADLAFLNGTLFALLAGGGCSHGLPDLPNGIVRVNTRDGSWQYLSNLSQFYINNPSAYPGTDDFELDGQPYSLLAFNGALFSIEANHGQLVRTSTQGSNSLVADISARLGHVVPTGLAEENGNLYISTLGHFPITPSWELLLTYSQFSFFVDITPGLATRPSDLLGYKLANARAGLTGALNLKVGPDGLLYALEFSTAAGYPTPGTGKVVRLTRNGTWEDVVFGLTVPTGMAFGPDRALYIGNFGDAPPGAGQILRVVVPM
jgi:hypothetical protein